MKKFSAKLPTTFKEYNDVLEKVCSLKQAGKDNEAFKLLEQITKITLLPEAPSTEEAYRLCLLAARLNEETNVFPQKVIGFYERALNLSVKEDDAFTIHRGLGSAYIDAENFSKAVEHLEKALVFAPQPEDREELYRYVVIAYKNLDRYPEALSVADKLIQTIDNREYGYTTDQDTLCCVYNDKAWCLHRMGKNEASEKCFHKALSFKKSEKETRSWVYGTWADVFVERGKMNEALKKYEQALRLSSDKEMIKKWTSYADWCRKELKSSVDSSSQKKSKS
ncbi:tetratricopeptide repeat protein [Candidatus Uhrbacteria bacterium]|nr:tetratricopeptide repeat protein [Candidatus Uhrbacteria bacterium]